MVRGEPWEGRCWWSLEFGMVRAGPTGLGAGGGLSVIRLRRI